MTTLARCCLCGFIILIYWCNTVSAQLLNIPDSNLKQAILETLNLPDEIPLTQQEMSRLTNLDAEERGITDLTGLEYAHNLTSLLLYFNPIVDISPLSHLTKLKKIHFDGCSVVDLSPLRNLTNLTLIILASNNISDISSLSTLTNLTHLNLAGNRIVNISPLANLAQLEKLWLSNNAIADITPLTGLKNLKKLYLADNPFHDFSPLAELEGVELDLDIDLSRLDELNVIVEVPDLNLRQLIRETLSLPEEIPLTQTQMLRLTELDAGGDRQITDLTGLEYATNLTSLLLYLNPIVDISPLSQLTKLKTIHFWGCSVVDLNPLRNLMSLRLIILASNNISDINPLSTLTNLIHLDLGGNHIVDVSPLANLTQLEKLWVNRNAITDVSPLIGLKNLKELYLADNPFHDFSSLLELEGVKLDIEISEGLNVVVEIPDPHLEQLIREALSLPQALALTRQQMQRLTELDAGGNRGITGLAGLEYATNLQSLNLYYNPIVNIGTLAHLTKLVRFNLWGCGIVDLNPLRNLKNLKVIVLGNNNISDISPLSELTNLTYLGLTRNRIVDFSPLASLVNLEKLFLQDNLGTDISPLQGLNLSEFSYDEICDIGLLLPPVRERIENRSLPSVFQAWNNIVGFDHLTWEESNVRHDLHFTPSFDYAVGWDVTLAEPIYGVATSLAGNLTRAHEVRQRRLAQNPNMVFLHGILIHGHPRDTAFLPDSDFWLRDENGEIVRNSYGEFLVNFLKPEVQDLIVKRVIAVEQCGLYDGIFFDGLAHNGTGFVGRTRFHSVTDEEIIQAMLNIFRSVRSQVRDDFLILINTNRSKATRFAEYVNGTFMETLTDALGGNPGGYTHGGLYEIESTLSWSEENFRSPQINCLEGWGIPTELPNSPDNRRWMRVFTTMSLTLSDGYVLYNTGIGGIPLRDPDSGFLQVPSSHDHSWYSFWDVDLGRPIGPKAQRYQNVPGLFIRKFTNGWAVYNRSGKPQEISLAENATGVASGQAGTTHRLADLDGEIYLTTKSFADVNDDGKVNVLDLIEVTNSLGKSTPDPNGDGVVNILDLVFVAQQFSQ